jgi:hypothetical protein
MPQLFEIDKGSFWNSMSFAPKIDSLFRPEEEHGRSRENDVVPPMRGGNGKMCDIRFRQRLSIFYFER